MRPAVRIIFATLIAGAGCSLSVDVETDKCEGYPDWTTSPYVLPYPVGKSYTVDQGNCAPPGFGHTGVAKYSYDFAMAIGTEVTAARGGVVVFVEESHLDGEIAAVGKDNALLIRHDDGTFALYGHFTHDGVAVSVGQTVQAGNQIGFSGNTGNTANRPHVHLSVTNCDPISQGSVNCPTIPITFRNTDPNPNGLQTGQAYTAR